MEAILDRMADKKDKARGRLIADVDDDGVLSAAVQLRASKLSILWKRHVSKSEVITLLLSEALADEISEVNRPLASEKKTKKRNGHD